jgi:hypothetical protein
MEKIKLFIINIKNGIKNDRGKDIMTVLIVIIVGLGSFGLGRLSKQNNNSGIKIEYKDQEANAVFSETDSDNEVINQLSNQSILVSNSLGKSFLASNRGKKYYPIGCSAGKTIKVENRIYFSTREDAEKAGYELSSSCK